MMPPLACVHALNNTKTMTGEIRPGLLVLHGNHAELLGDAVFAWLRRHPLQPLEEEVFLVQSNGVAEWLKMALATQAGVCAATRVELPARFLWRAYRQVLGRSAVPAVSALDKLPLTWRLMQTLPQVLQRPGFEPLAGFLVRGGMDRRLQLAQRLADLYDQYQVYRSDWLAAWASGWDVLPAVDGQAPAQAPALPDGQRWQALLWRELLAPLSASQRAGSRAQLHTRFVAALQGGPGAASAPATALARRVVLFGMTHVPMQTLQALAALSRHCQVLMAVPNPCRYHWADTIDGRELLRLQRRRHPLRAEHDLAEVPLQDMHAHAHPLLAAWGRQGRDFVRQLDAFDDALAAQQHFAVPKIDLFDDGPGQNLLQQVQARIRDLVPRSERPADEPAVDPADRSIVFHIAHSAQREVEILHDQLLALLAQPPAAGAAPLQPRDIVVMVPDIEAFAPAIRSVFGAYGRADARHIPYDIADLQDRGHNPVMVALEWLLRLPQQRCRLSELRDLLDVPAIATHFGVDPADLPRLAQWMAGAGVRWGLHAEQRESLGLGACGDACTWAFGLRRMLLGYASGDAAPAWGEIEPYAEVGGLDAALAGSLASLLDALAQWWQSAAAPATPDTWAERLRSLLDSFLTATTDADRQTLAALQDALRAWLDACATAAFADAVPLAVAREAWLSGVDDPGLSRRFRAGGVTFCTLLPMRAIPFEVLCLLGMNDGDYPRSRPRSDFDLMGQPGQARPGDRSRRDDDRQLMLEAVLSARRVLYLSWAGRSVRDHSAQPPSVLVSQLRDYLADAWPGDVLAPRTTEHPLQPFSRRYFEQPAAGLPAAQRLFTLAREWRAAHLAAEVAMSADTAPVPEALPPLTVATLARFLKNPVKEFFRQRLDVVLRDDDSADEDDEVLAVGGLPQYQLLSDALAAVLRDSGPTPGLAAQVAAQTARARRSGLLPLGELGRRAEQALAQTLQPMLVCWQDLQALYPLDLPKEPLRLALEGVVLDDWLAGVRGADAQRVVIEMQPSVLVAGVKKPGVVGDKMVTAWVRMLVSSACGRPVVGVVVGRDARVHLQPLPQADALAQLATLLQAWREGMTTPLPLPCKTGLAWVAGASDVRAVYEGSPQRRGEVQDACLARQYADFDSLVADARFAELAQRVLAPLRDWALNHATLQMHAAEAGDE